jgi:epoxyqueuosine reductase
MKNAIGEKRGKFFPKQPELNQDAQPISINSAPDEEWFISTITDKIARHPENGMEYPFFIYGCGLCATGVPCESGIPKPLQVVKSDLRRCEKF